MEKEERKRTSRQNASIHLGCQNIADLLVESNITLNTAIRSLEVRPSRESVKDVFRSIARAKYGVESTTELMTDQVSQVWEDLVKAISEATGIYIAFPSQESTESYIQSLEENA